ncbi:conserved hypothetical protein [Methylomarinovum caldicuralii]|uniref:DUF211 domain-containing protein n=1 Tax=Methylomarinovum caldicuralii TaxID=438856 RepID=A0AAU9CJ26_9GAMM|nr:DUF211 domain-containing protein [Methylomarinovum caldicuralii]BCX83030.1 conserved hypothetical protein [Methylomarinovum caldicuralii]
MTITTRLVLDILKPHRPNALDFVRQILLRNDIHRVRLNLAEMDEKTETVLLHLEGTDIDYEDLVETIARMGGVVHSIDEVEVREAADARSEAD